MFAWKANPVSWQAQAEREKNRVVVLFLTQKRKSHSIIQCGQVIVVVYSNLLNMSFMLIYAYQLVFLYQYQSNSIPNFERFPLTSSSNIVSFK